MPTTGTQPEDVASLQQQIVRLQHTLRDMETQREQQDRLYRRRLLGVGVGISLIIHLCLLIYLASQYRMMPGSDPARPVNLEFAVLSDEELTELEMVELDDAMPEVESVIDETLDDSIEVLDPAIPAAQLEPASAGSMPTLGGSGDGGEGPGRLSGGAAGTSFFGVSSKGMRFAFIVDRSGSMGNDLKMSIALSELARSVSSLPDYASFYVVFFSDRLLMPSAEDGWTKAKPSNVERFTRSLNMITPGGGTLPFPAFSMVFSLETRPDVIFFLTDGQIPEDTDDLVDSLNDGGSRVVINTIAFGDPTSQETLKNIAKESGGVYRFVPTGGR